ncbi:MAG: hypothetical protein O3A53_01155 [Acidobacteria bacterium]|nr:hypothetical protein [Acidobacteriota bacterium]MDA1233389.1 hypothetical protein [Acidobacteriota bacterium]
MSYEHAKNDPIAEAEIVVARAEEENDVRDPRLVELYLDTDELYRWYEEDAATEFASDSLVGALEEATGAWDGFQLVELRGRAVEPDEEVEETYAADEIVEMDDDFDDD